MHVPVLLKESIEGLALHEGAVVFDGTAGGGGHSKAIAEAIGQSGTLMVTDRDIDALKRVEERLDNFSGELIAELSNFAVVDELSERHELEGFDAMILDLGLSSFQLEESGRGFSFKASEPLLMSFEKDPPGLTAETIVNDWGKEELTELIEVFGGEGTRDAGQIAEAITKARPLKSTDDLVKAIESVSKGRGKLHPATKTFQALRMAVNSEYQSLVNFLPRAWQVLKTGGRLAIISFHEVEDREVKRFFKEKSIEGEGTLITKKPIVPGEAEVSTNPRSRSGKLRIIEKV